MSLAGYSGRGTSGGHHEHAGVVAQEALRELTAVLDEAIRAVRT
ncbi:hypothetical protein [Streptomyces sp. MB09-02B]|nr:hypothetical protein [Streptomyces sp. MB09-02B]MDX3641923.1 hypothetical protein [Streptomyces sp. MB09-02B]